MDADNSPILREMAVKAANLYRRAVELDAIYSPENDPKSYFFRKVTRSYMDRIKSIRDRSITKSPQKGLLRLMKSKVLSLVKNMILKL